MANAKNQKSGSFPTAGMQRTLYAVRYHMLGSTGPENDGYWMAEWLDPGQVPEVACHRLAPGRLIPNDGRFYLRASGRTEVLTQHQVNLRAQHCLDRGEVVDLRWVPGLPEGSIVT